MTTSGIVVGLVSGARFLPVTWRVAASPLDALTLLSDLLLVLVLLSFLAMLVTAVRLWRPLNLTAPGPQDVRILYDEYIALDQDEAFNHILLDLVHSIEHLQHANAIKAALFDRMSLAFQAQIIALILAIIWPLLRLAVP